EDLELDLAVAKDVGVRRSSRAVFGEKVGENLIPIRRGKIACMEWNAEQRTDAQRVGAVAIGLAFAETIVFDPVLHEHADDVATLLAQAQRRDGRIDATRHADDDGRRRRHAIGATRGVAATYCTALSGMRCPRSQSSTLHRTSGLRRRAYAAAISSRVSH